MQISLFHFLKKSFKVENVPGFSYFIHLAKNFLNHSTGFDKEVLLNMLKYRRYQFTIGQDAVRQKI